MIDLLLFEFIEVFGNVFILSQNDYNSLVRSGWYFVGVLCKFREKYWNQNERLGL